MKTTNRQLIRNLILLLLVWVIGLACTMTQTLNPSRAEQKGATPEPGSMPNPKAGQVTPAASSIPPDLTSPDPLDHLLALHSVQIDLNTTRPDNSSFSIHIEIDSSGNMHVKSNESAPDAKDFPQGFDPKVIVTNSEIWVISGKSYIPNEVDPKWVDTPVDNNYPETLSVELHGMDGPVLWLNLLPDGSIQPAGTETVGGFAADKYTVNGKEDNQTISGTLWEEPQTDALVQAELHIPGALLSPPDQPQSGEMKIILKAQKANIQPVILPTARPRTAKP